MTDIIKAEEKHVPAIVDLWWEFMKYSEGIDLLYTAENDAKPVFENDYLRPAMNDDNSLVLVTIQDDKVTGYSYSLIMEKSLLEQRDEYGIIHDMFITESARNNGTGEKILETIFTWFTSRGINRIELDVIENNTIADSFWRKQGFSNKSVTLFRDIRA